MKTSDYIVDFLVEHGIEHAYGYQGTMIAHLVDSLGLNSRIENHVCYNEQGAAFAAVGEAKATGKCAFAYSTSGPGAVNLLSGIADAYYDSVPVIFITGQLNTYEYLDIPGIKQHGFQEMDVISTVKPVVKYCEKVTNEKDIKRILEEAWYTANEGRPGPVVIDLPMNMQRMDIDPDELVGFDTDNACLKDNKDIEKIALEINEIIGEAKKPVIVLGNGISTIDRSLVRKAIKKLGKPVVTSMLGRDILEYENPLNFGFIGAAYGHRYANIIVHKKADCVISFGSSLCKRQTGIKTEKFAKNAKIVRVDIDSTELSRKVHQNEKSYKADATQVFLELSKVNESGYNLNDWVDTCNTIKSELIRFDNNCSEREPNKLISIMSDCSKEIGAICCDVGQHQVWVAQSFKVKNNQKLLFSGGHGAMGFALPAAIGAHYGVKKPVMSICGDGAFQMNIQELQWVFREKIPVTIFVMDNSSLGLIHQQQEDMLDGRYYGSMAVGGYDTPDFMKIGEAYGLNSLKVKGEDELRKALEDIDYSVPNLVHVILDTKSKAFPKTPFGEEMHNQKPFIPEELMKKLLSL